MSEYIERALACELCAYKGTGKCTICTVPVTPAADVVEVVRCRDCKYRVKTEGICAKLSNNYEPLVYCDSDDYCSMGVREERTR